MRGFLRAAGCGALLLAVAACAGPSPRPSLAREAAPAAPPHLVAVRSFAVPAGVVEVDPSFGFSLRRGAPGVPKAKRAAAVGRAAAFALSDGLTRALRAGGLDAASTLDTHSAVPAGALVVSGVFDKIDQGRPRRVGRVAPGAGMSRVIATSRLTAPSGAVLLSLHTDSAQLPGAGISEIHGRRVHTADANRDAGRVGREIASRVLAFARRAGWLPPAQ